MKVCVCDCIIIMVVQNVLSTHTLLKMNVSNRSHRLLVYVRTLCSSFYQSCWTCSAESSSSFKSLTRHFSSSSRSQILAVG